MKEDGDGLERKRGRSDEPGCQARSADAKLEIVSMDRIIDMISKLVSAEA